MNNTYITLINVKNGEITFKPLNEKLTPNFSVYELQCKDKTTVILYHSDLLDVAQATRSYYNKAIVTVSAFRTIQHNINCGGVEFSNHLKGVALDIKCPKGVELDDFYNTIIEMSTTICDYEMEIIKYNDDNFVHVAFENIK